MTIDLVARKQKLSEDIEKVSQDIEKLQANLQQAMQVRERMVGGLLMLDELLQAPDMPPAGGGDDA